MTHFSIIVVASLTRRTQRMAIGRIFLLGMTLHLLINVASAMTINIAARSGGFETLCRNNLEPFYNKTGTTVNVFAFNEADLRNEMLSDLKKGSPYYDGYVGPASEFYNLIICPDCQPDQRPLIQPLSEWVRDDGAMAWYDIAMYERTITTVYKGEIYTVPLDADAMLLYYREDILAQAGFDNPPDTWEEYIKVSQALQNVDMNGDGVPDYATCTGKTNSSKFDLNAYFFMSYVSSYMQYNGTHQGVFFDAETMAPMSNTTAFAHVWEIYKEITRYGPELQTDIWTSWDLFAEGRCAMVLTFGDILGIVKNTSVSNVMSSTILPGTREVYNRKTQQMEQCTADLCPFMDKKGINRAPFATPGYTGFVSRFTRDDRKRAAYDFLSFLSQPAQSQVGVFEGLGQDIFRKSQLNATLWFDSGFSNVTTVNTINTLRAVLESPNVAIPMPAIEQIAYFTAFTTWNKCYLYDECTLQEAQAGLTRDWESLLKQYGLRDQHTLYAVMLGNPEPVYSYQIDLAYGLMVAFICVATFIIGVALFFLFFVVKCRHYKLIRATQPTFHYGTIVGAIAMLIGILLINIQPPVNDYCTSSIWLILIGFGLLQANLSAKMFRIWRLSDVKSLEIRVIKDIHLVPFVVGIVALYIVPLAVWTALDPPELHVYTYNLPQDQYMMICGTNATGVKIFIVLLALSCALLLVGCVFAYLNRNVATIYNESRQVAASIYTFSFAAIVLVPMIFTISDYMVVHITLSAVICFCVLVTLVSLFLFKLLRIIRKGDKTPNGKKESQSMHNTSSFTEQSNQLNELKIEVEKLLKENNELRNEVKTLKSDTCHQSA